MRLNHFLATEIVLGYLVLLRGTARAQTQAAASPDFFETNIARSWRDIAMVAPRTRLSEARALTAGKTRSREVNLE